MTDVRFSRDPRTMTSAEVWAVLEATPGFNERMRQAEAELDAGLGTRYRVHGKRLVRVADPTLVDDTAPEEPDSDPRDDDVSETGLSLGDADPTGPEDHPADPE